ncbi:transmembrane emp24 domain-containing protein 6 [Callorhinchus milii]|uniref:Transmembrane p24 trafficking protein 6 n=1 Tax=Callorhinchus milii TaxID=7868 RepID=A0A4W3J670_CALMI|nr:transmembrane emp24 domain-containing protein 6 [Callorhinchus milii]|eukprot:gi/632944386/ref/XP_007887480.1/ PREDICTED: transmembrane emp24 domain-containing protein 6 [Callorhinchus milii]
MSTAVIVFGYLCFILLTNTKCQRIEAMSDSSDPDVFGGADQYDFSIIVQGGGQECFWQYAEQMGYFYFSYEVQWVMGIQNSRAITVSINAPSGSLIDTSAEASGQINFKTNESGFYQFCLNNFLTSFGSKQIFLNFGVYYDRFDDKKRENLERIGLNDTVSAIRETAMKVENYVFHMWRYYNFARMRKGADYFLGLANNNYVTWWSLAQSAVIVLSGVLQVYFVKRLFDVKNTTPTSKPRC